MPYTRNNKKFQISMWQESSTDMEFIGFNYKKCNTRSIMAKMAATHLALKASISGAPWPPIIAHMQAIRGATMIMPPEVVSSSAMSLIPILPLVECEDVISGIRTVPGH